MPAYPRRTGPVEVRPKEVILVCLALLLLAFSMTLFFKHWKKNYWDINQLPYYAYLYKVNVMITKALYDVIDVIKNKKAGKVGLDQNELISCSSHSASYPPMLIMDAE